MNCYHSKLSNFNLGTLDKKFEGEHFKGFFCHEKIKIDVQKWSPVVFCKNSVLWIFAKFTVKHLCQSLFNKLQAETYNFVKKESLAQVFSCQFCQISKNTFS